MSDFSLPLNPDEGVFPCTERFISRNYVKYKFGIPVPEFGFDSTRDEEFMIRPFRNFINR